MQNGLIVPRDINTDRKIKDANKLMESLLSSVDLKKEDYPLVEEALKLWLTDNSYFSNYDKWRLVRPDSILVRLFRFEKQNENLFNPDGSLYTSIKILPLVKVIKVHPMIYADVHTNIKVGDVLHCPESITNVTLTNDWLKWNEIMSRERPQPNIPEPDKFGGELSRWLPTKVTCNKLYPTEDDNWTFLRATSEFKLIYEN